MLPSVFPKKFRIIQKSQKNCVFWTLTKSDDRYGLKSLIKWKFGRFVNFCRKPHVKILKIANFPEFLKFQDHSIIQLKMAIFADLKQNILKTAQNIVQNFGIKWKHDERNSITKLYCPKRSGSFKNEVGSFKNLNFSKKKNSKIFIFRL